MSYDLLQDPPRRLFFQYLIPSISATMVTSIYLLADSIMVGKGIGELAIAALNLVLPRLLIQICWEDYLPVVIYK